MCLVVVARGAHPRCPLILIANRDEVHDRPADRMGWWDGGTVLAGRDRQGCGTWLAVSRTGHVAAVTNFRERPARAGALSRGELPLLALATAETEGKGAVTALAAAVAARGARYGGFNLLLADPSNACWFTNRGDEPQRMPPGVHAVSNGPIDATWPKVERSHARLAAAVTADRVDEASLLAIARDERPARDEDLPATGVGVDLERFLAPCFIRGDRYGTRSVTLLWHMGSRVEIVEHRFGAGGEPAGRSAFCFRVDGASAIRGPGASDPDAPA